MGNEEDVLGREKSPAEGIPSVSLSWSEGELFRGVLSWAKMARSSQDFVNHCLDMAATERVVICVRCLSCCQKA